MRLFRIIGLLIRVPLYALYGAWALVVGGVSLLGRARRGARLLSSSLPCPSCGEANTLHGRWKCRGCSAVYHGFVGHCPLCGAGASFFPCAKCGISISLGRRP